MLASKQPYIRELAYLGPHEGVHGPLNTPSGPVPYIYSGIGFLILVHNVKILNGERVSSEDRRSVGAKNW